MAGARPGEDAALPIKIPPDAKVLQDRSGTLDLIRIIGDLADKLPELKDPIKKRLKDRDARFIQSDLVVGALRGGGPGGQHNGGFAVVDPAKLFALVKSGQITQSQFLDCVTVRTEAVGKILGDDQIAKISKLVPGRGSSEPSLCTEFKTAVPIKRQLELLAQARASLSAAAPGSM
jgi:hypothetical protein